MTKNSDNKYRKWDMMCGNTLWISPRTYKNMRLILEFLTEKTNESKSKKPRFTFAQLSEELHIDDRSVSLCCRDMAFKLIPLVTLHAVKYPTKGSSQIANKVQLCGTICKS